MPSGEWDSFLKSNLKKYRKPDKTYKDVRRLLAEYKELQPKLGGKAPDPGKGKEIKLICLSGTVAVTPANPSQGYGFTKLPVCVWLLGTHPDDPPACYLAPVNGFAIQPSKFLDARGKIYLPYLHDWQAPRSNLSDLFRIIRDIFSKYFPYVPAGTSPAHGNNKAPSGIRLRGDRVDEPERIDAIMKRLPHPAELVKDAQAVLDMFPDVRIKPAIHAFTEGIRSEHLEIEGTIPIVFKGGNYNIPISVWIRNSYPSHAPHCFVIPAQGMMVKPSKFVDPNGKVYLPYLHEWKYPASDLSGLIQIMCLMFGENCPVYSTADAANASPNRKPVAGKIGQWKTVGNETVLDTKDQQDTAGASASPGPSGGPSASAGPRIRMGEGTLVKKIKEENERLKDSQLCKICMDTEMQVLFMPCSHFATCEECSTSLKMCPICRQNIVSTVKVFKS